MRAGMSESKTGKRKEKKYQRRKDSGLGRERTKALERKKLSSKLARLKKQKHWDTRGYRDLVKEASPRTRH